MKHSNESPESQTQVPSVTFCKELLNFPLRFEINDPGIGTPVNLAA